VSSQADENIQWNERFRKLILVHGQCLEFEHLPEELALAASEHPYALEVFCWWITGVRASWQPFDGVPLRSTPELYVVQFRVVRSQSDMISGVVDRVISDTRWSPAFAQGSGSPCQSPEDRLYDELRGAVETAIRERVETSRLVQFLRRLEPVEGPVPPQSSSRERARVNSVGSS
jgi:hypothetical protein